MLTNEELLRLKKLKLYSGMILDTIDELQSDLYIYRGLINGDNK